jgi:arabinogalactan oligomer/maltooligosaccharide transport system permease protein
MAIDLWSTLWLVGPALLSLWWLSSPVISAWAKGSLSVQGAEDGLSRNKYMSPRLGAIGSHILLLHAVMLVLIPVLWILDVAMSPGNILGGDIGISDWTGEHFSKMLDGDSSFWIWMRNSLIVSLGTTLMGLALAVPAAYAFSRFRFSGREGSMFAFLLVQMFPGIIILVPYFMVMKSLGLLNTSLGLILAYSVTALPLCVWMLKGFFDTVPKELEEAALLDGCNQFEVFWKVILPLSLPAVAVTALFSFLAAWNEYLLALTFNTSNDMYTLPVGLASLISSTGQAWGDFAAASLLVSIPVVILFIVFQKFLIQGLSAGSVKG